MRKIVFCDPLYLSPIMHLLPDFGPALPSPILYRGPSMRIKCRLDGFLYRLNEKNFQLLFFPEAVDFEDNINYTFGTYTRIERKCACED